MRRTLVQGAVACFGTLMVMSGALAAPGIPWAKTLPDAMAQAKKSNKLVMMDFYTDW